MTVESPTDVMESLMSRLKLDDPWVPPRSWDSIPSQNGASCDSHSSNFLYPTSTVSEPSLVRLVMNALQGVESALISIDKLSAVFCNNSADRTSHRIPSLWTRCLSTSALGNLLKSVGQFGCIIFLLHKFVSYFRCPDFDGIVEQEENQNNDSCEDGKGLPQKCTLTNQAFAVAVGKVVDGYISALNTLSASVSLRRSSKTNLGGCLTNIGHSEVTMLEVYLHTTGLRTQMEALGNICNIKNLALNFSVSSFEDLSSKANLEFSVFPRGGALLSFLYAQLKVGDPDHCALLKFLFLQTYEPYCGFIRSWIYDGRISDPYKEFIVEYVDERPTSAYNLPLATIRVQDGVAVPSFLEEFLIPLFRAGQQLQVIMKLVELCNAACANGNSHEGIFPCLIGFSSEYPWFASPLTFDKGTIETMVLARASYYQQMLEKIDNILTKFEYGSQQANSQGILLLENKHGKNVDHPLSSDVDESLFPPLTDGREKDLPDSEASSIVDECSYTEDLLESSDCSSIKSSEEQNDASQMIDMPHGNLGLEKSYLSALDFSFSLSTNNSVQKLPQDDTGSFFGNIPYMVYENSDYVIPCRKGANISEPEFSQTPETLSTSREHDIWMLDSHDAGRGSTEISWENTSDSVENLSKRNLGFSRTGMLDCINSGNLENASKINATNRDRDPYGTFGLSNAFTLPEWKLKSGSTFFSMNPALNKSPFLNRRTTLRERTCSNYRESSSYFDFTSVKDPCKKYVDKLASSFQHEFSATTEAAAADTINCGQHHVERCSDMNLANNAKLSYVISPVHIKAIEEGSLPSNISGGSAWETLLCRSCNISNKSTRDRHMRLVAALEMPLDFVIRKCVLEEILLQYKYLSKLTIKFLIEGFELQEHLLALRRYHFMEVADWADLFIMSLWQHKWHVNEVDGRIPEIQGVLELSVQRSSCDGDPFNDRLYVYLKRDEMVHLSASATGIHSFDFLGLGYRVDWPVSIILTPAAIRIYSKIFSFLIQVKLAVFSLSDVWFSLKSSGGYQNEQEAHHVSILSETRHKLNHFVTTLQQYVQSQLSQVSWCRFLHSLKHKVNDMMDLESVHMVYLTESLHICFLSEETQSIAGIMQNILQCAMDFRSCLNGSISESRFNVEKLTARFSQIDFHQVISIRTTFAKNLKELYLTYLRSPKHGEFGIPRFWDYLNYNEYYAEVVSKQMRHHIFPS